MSEGWSAGPEPDADWQPDHLHVVDGVRVWARERADEPGVVDVELAEPPASGPAGMTTGVVPRHPVSPEELGEILRESVEYLTSEHDC